MIRNSCFLALLSLLSISCNPIRTQFTFIYNNKGPNKEIAEQMELLLESTYFNTDIVLIEGLNTEANLDSLMLGTVDMALVENYIQYRSGINSAFSVYSEILHIFYRSDQEITSFQELVYNRSLNIGIEDSPTYNLMMDLFDFFSIDSSRINITPEEGSEEVKVELTNLLDDERLAQYQGFRLFSFTGSGASSSMVEGIALNYPKMSPFMIPLGTYMGFSDQPISTFSVDVVMMVRSSLGEIPVNDLTGTMLRNRQIFTSIDPLLYHGLKEDFDQGKLNIPIHEGARVFLDRDEPSFVERYAEIGGVILSLVIALWSGLVSLTKWQAQKKKDRIDEFYEGLILIKNKVPRLKRVNEISQNIRFVKSEQNRAFELLINEELVANESFRIYMELSKETITELRSKLKSAHLAN